MGEWRKTEEANIFVAGEGRRARYKVAFPGEDEILVGGGGEGDHGDEVFIQAIRVRDERARERAFRPGTIADVEQPLVLPPSEGDEVLVPAFLVSLEDGGLATVRFGEDELLVTYDDLRRA